MSSIHQLEENELEDERCTKRLYVCTSEKGEHKQCNLKLVDLNYLNLIQMYCYWISLSNNW